MTVLWSFSMLSMSFLKHFLTALDSNDGKTLLFICEIVVDIRHSQ